jgi:alpha/beta superfamily hydrolase
MALERFDFPNPNGQRLAALLDRPPGEPTAYALFAHCFTCGKDNLAASRIAQVLGTRGIAVLRFDFTGIGASDGEFANAGFSANVADLVAAADHLRRTHRAPALLIGHSLGGAAVMAAAAEVPEARAVVTIAAPADPAHAIGLFKDRIPEINARGEAEVVLAGRSFRIRRELLDDLRCSSSTRPWMRPSESITRTAFSRRPNTRKASSRWPAPITCSAARAMRCTWVT